MTNEQNQTPDAPATAAELPDFDKLRAERNAAMDAAVSRVCDELGWNPIATKCYANRNDCYCACPDGPCEHKWDGVPYESADGREWSSTCSRCGTSAISHSLRTCE